MSRRPTAPSTNSPPPAAASSRATAPAERSAESSTQTSAPPTANPGGGKLLDHAPPPSGVRIQRRAPFDELDSSRRRWGHRQASPETRSAGRFPSGPRQTARP